MMILAPIPTVHDITGKENGVVIGLIPIDLISIQSIIEDEETGFAIFYYKNGGSLETRTPFTEIFSLLDKQGIVDCTGLDRCLKVSKNLKDYIDELKRLENLPNLQ